MSRSLRRCVFAAVAFAFVTPVTALAQRPSPGDVFIATLDHFPDIDAKALIVREAGRSIVILRDPGVTPEALAMCLRALAQVSERELEPGQGALVPITGFSVRTPPRGERLRLLRGVLARLEHAPSTEIGSFGPGRWVRYR